MNPYKGSPVYAWTWRMITASFILNVVVITLAVMKWLLA